MAKKILVADDQPHVARLVQVNLERAGYEVVTANDGKETLEQVNKEKPALVVLDYSLPDMDGFEVLQNLRENPATRELPVIMMFAKVSAVDVWLNWQNSANRYGVNAYLTKPFNPAELISMIKRIFASLDGAAE